LISIGGRRSGSVDGSVGMDGSAAAAFAADHSPDLLVVVDGDATVRYANGAGRRILAVDPADAVGRSMLDFVHPDDLTSALGAFGEASRSTGHHLPLHVRLRTADGSWEQCEVSGQTVEDQGGTWLVLAVREREGRSDVIERRERLERLLQHASVLCARARWYEVDAVVEQVLAALADVVGAESVELAWDECDGGLRTRAAWTARPGLIDVRRTGPAFESLWGTSTLAPELLCFSSDLAALPGSTTRDHLVAAGVEAVMETRLHAHPAMAVLRITFGEGWRRWDDANVDVVALVATGLLSTLGRAAAEEALHERARRDSLTGLFNREELYRILSGHLAVAGPARSSLGVLYGDLDRFKDVNDLLGHAAGDRLLESVADALRLHTRERDAIARFGGDEFVVVCPELADEADLRAIANRVEAAVRRSAPAGIAVGISFGIAVATPGMDADALLAEADRAMYRSKHRHRAIR
jgi:diguanylate cyclase (GGDEF)-like protein/PAS domain S-box-containing protein